MANHDDRKCLKDRVVGPLSLMAILWLMKGGLLDLPTYWDDPPRNRLVFLYTTLFSRKEELNKMWYVYYAIRGHVEQNIILIFF